MNTQATMKVQVNGETVEVPSGASLSDLIAQLDIRTRAIAVEINQTLQPSDRFSACSLREGDVIEIVTLVGGG